MHKLTGKIKSWEDKKGFGFVEVPGEPEAFMHYSALMNSNARKLAVGTPVKTMIVEGLRGPQATLVELLED